MTARTLADSPADDIVSAVLLWCTLAAVTIAILGGIAYMLCRPTPEPDDQPEPRPDELCMHAGCPRDSVTDTAGWRECAWHKARRGGAR